MIFKFLNFLKKNAISYCVINGYREIINHEATDSDNDILFKQKDFKNIDEIIKKFSVECNFCVVQNMHHDILAKNFFVYNPEKMEFLNLDLYGELSRKNIIYFDEKNIFNTLRYYKNIPILSPEKEFINYFIKKLDKKDFTENKFQYLCSLYSSNKELCKIEARRFFPNVYKMVLEAFMENDFEKIQKNQSVIIADFYTLKNYNIARKLVYAIRIIKRIYKPTGLVVSFMGPDGSGKSTIIEKLLTRKLPFRRKDYFHLKPIAFNKSKSITISDPHIQAPYSSAKSYIKLLYFIYQYNIGWLKKIDKLKIKSSLIIFDRYFDDILVDTKRYRYGGSLSIAKFISYFIPKPDLYFIFTTDAKVIYERKQEVSFEELKRQIKRYRTLADGKRYFNIDVNQPVGDVYREVLTIMMSKMNERY